MGDKPRWVGTALAAALLVTGGRVAHAAPQLSVAPLQLLEVLPELKEVAVFNSASAFDGNDWLVVHLSEATGASRLSGTWVGSDGSTSPPFAIGRGIADTHASLVFDGDTFIASWHGGYLDDGFYAQRITKAGPGPLIRATLPTTGTDWASDGAVDDAGQAHFIACTGGSAGSAAPWNCVTYRLVGDELQQQATFEQAAVRSLDLQVSDAGAVAAAWTANGVAALRLADDGSLLETVLLAEEHNRPSLIKHGDGFAMAWGDGPQVRVAALDAGGNLLSNDVVETEHTLFGLGSDIIGAPPPPRAELFDVKLVAVPDGYLLVANASNSCEGFCGYPLVAKALSPELEPVAGAPLQVPEETSPDFRHFAVAAGASDVLFTSTTARLIDPVALTASARHPLAHTVSEQSMPLSAPGGDGWLLAWREDDTGEARAVRLDEAGVVVEEISDFAPPDTFLYDVAGSPNGWLVATGTGGGLLYTTSISADGEASTSQLLGSGHGALVTPTVNGWLVVWMRREDREPTEPAQTSLIADRMGSDGAHLGTSVLATATWPDRFSNFDVVARGDGFSVVVTRPDGAGMIHTDGAGMPIGEPEALVLPTADVLSVQVVQTPSETWTLWREAVDCTPNLCPCLDCLLWLGPTPDVKRFGLGKLYAASPLRSVGEQVVATLVDNDGLKGDTHVVVTDSRGPIFMAPSLSGLRQPFVSAARDNRLLLSAIASTDRYGLRANRVHLAFVDVSEASGAGGEGGATGSGGAADQVGTSGNGTGGTSAAGGTSATQGGEASGGIADVSPQGGADGSIGGRMDLEPSSDDVNSGCDCSVTGGQRAGEEDYSPLALLVVLTLAARSRRSRRTTD